jgi:hypothetical protein
MAGESALSDILTIGELREQLECLDADLPVMAVCGNLHVDGVTGVLINDEGLTLIPEFWEETMEGLGTLEMFLGEEEEVVDEVEVPEAR